MDNKDQGISIYVHWPYCESKCPYCDFNSHVRESIDHDLMSKLYIRELDLYRDLIKNKKIKSIFFGGGTPSLAKPKLFEEIIEWLSKVGIAESDLEITIEANPGSSDVVKFAEFAKAGINRVSIGVQSLRDDSLKFLGRKHSAEAAKSAIKAAQKIFNNYSFDIIYALPYHNTENWLAELEDIVRYAGPHISLYQLTIEKGTKFFSEYSKNKFQLPNEDLAADLYELTESYLANYGLYSYEVSNYARPGNECKHNLVYWRYGCYIGIGPGAHGRFNLNGDRVATENVYAPEKWIELLERGERPIKSINTLSDLEQYQEKILMGLRLSEGVSKEIFPQNQELQRKIENMLDHGVIELSNQALSLTKRGRLVLNSVVGNLISL